MTSLAPARRRRDQSGAAALELVFMAPVLLALIVVVIAAGRVVQSKGDASDVAYAAARAASLATRPGEAQRAAQLAADRAVDEEGSSCQSVAITVDSTQFRAGGQVSVTAECRADLVDVAGFGVPSSRTFVSTAAVPIDKYRDLP